MTTAGRVAVVSNNIECDRNVQYWAAVEKYFRANDWTITQTLDDADKVVITGCGFIDLMYRKIQDALKDVKNAELAEDDVFILGCATKTHERALSRDFSGHVVHLEREFELDQLVGSRISFEEIELPKVFELPCEAVRGVPSAARRGRR